MSYTDLASSSKHHKNGMSKRRGNDGRADQPQFCMNVLTVPSTTQSVGIASSPPRLYRILTIYTSDATIVPDYYKVIRKPTDLRTLKTKLGQNEYSDPRQVYSDY